MNYYEIVCAKEAHYVCYVMNENAERCWGISELSINEKSLDEMINKLRKFLSSSQCKRFHFQNIEYSDLDEVLEKVEHVMKSDLKAGS